MQRNRRTLLLIAGIPLLVVLTATGLWFAVTDGKLDLVGMLGTANRGTLLTPPVSLLEMQAVDAQDRLFSAAAKVEPLWRILIPIGASCDASCEQVFYYTRQIHTAMGKDKFRIERVALALAAEENPLLLVDLQEKYPQLKVLYTSAASFAAQLGQFSVAKQAPAYYLVDPNGWVILSYFAGEDGKDVMADLKFLLKNSNG